MKLTEKDIECLKAFGFEYEADKISGSNYDYVTYSNWGFSITVYAYEFDRLEELLNKIYELGLAKGKEEAKEEIINSIRPKEREEY